MQRFGGWRLKVEGWVLKAVEISRGLAPRIAASTAPQPPPRQTKPKAGSSGGWPIRSSDSHRKASKVQSFLRASWSILSCAFLQRSLTLSVYRLPCKHINTGPHNTASKTYSFSNQYSRSRTSFTMSTADELKALGNKAIAAKNFDEAM